MHHLLAGSFRAAALFLLAFSPAERTLGLVQRAPALGPHQFLARSAGGERVYATSWALPPALSSWAVERGAGEGGAWAVRHVDSAPISACLPPRD